MSRLKDIDWFFNGNNGALRGIDRLTVIAECLDKMFKEEDATEEEVAYIKSLIQAEALQAVKDNDNKGLVAMCTGSGKSKIAVDWSKELEKEIEKPSIIVSVPTEKLRDENWKEEYEKWGAEFLWDGFVSRTCYASLAKIENQHYDLMVMDEGHNLTENNTQFFDNNRVDRLLVLTATPPHNDEKKALLRKLGIDIVFELPLDLAVKMRIVAPYEVIIIETRLDGVNKNIKAGTKDKPFMTTEMGMYAYHEKVVRSAMFSSNPKVKAAAKWKILARMRFIYNLPSKTEAAKKILSLIPQGERVLTFCGGIEQADNIATKVLVGDKEVPQSFHSKSPSDEWFKAFSREEIERCTCVNSLNEGQNLTGLDVGFVVQLNSNPLNTVQRIGRIVRKRPGHKALIIILCSTETQDLAWTQKAIAGLNKSKITYVRYENILSGNFKLYDN